MEAIEQARMAVAEYLASSTERLPDGDRLVVVDDKTLERPWGWVFFYTSELWLRTGDARYALAGNAPLFVERDTGRILPAGTALSVEHYIANYERTGRPEP